MSDYSAKVHMEVGGDRQTLDPGGSVKFGNVTFTVNAAGQLVLSGLPTTNPAVAGALYSNSGVLTLGS
jgi:hypothetical protein